MMTKWKVLAKQQTEASLESLQKQFIKRMHPFTHERITAW